MAAALVIFVLAASEFGVPGVLRVRVYTTEIFTAFAALYDPGRAALLALPLLALCLVVAVVAVALLGDRFVTARRGADTPGALRVERSHSLSRDDPVVLVTALALPIAVLMREALNSPSIVAAIGGSGEAIANSLRLATIGASAVVGIAMWLGYVLARTRGRLGRLADIGLVVLFAVPGTLVGVGLIEVWNRAGPFGALYGTDSMLVLAYLARLLPIAILALAASSRTVPLSQEEAAAVSGAGWLRTMWRIVVPQMRLGLVAAWLIVFVLAFGELGVSILVAPPGETTLPIRIYTTIANAPSSSVAVLALLQASIILGPLAVLGAILRTGKGRDRAGHCRRACVKTVRSPSGPDGRVTRGVAGGGHRDPGPEWVGEDDVAAPDRGPRGAGQQGRSLPWRRVAGGRSQSHPAA